MQTYLLYSFSLLTIQNLPLFVFNLVTTQESQYASTTTSTSHMVSTAVRVALAYLMSWIVSICHTSWHKFCYKIRNVKSHICTQTFPVWVLLNIHPKPEVCLLLVGWCVSCQVQYLSVYLTC